jgi:hypothetical protein
MNSAEQGKRNSRIEIPRDKAAVAEAYIVTVFGSNLIKHTSYWVLSN